MYYLKRKYYNGNIDFNNLTEKDIIYFCRDALNVKVNFKSADLKFKDIEFDMYENEILYYLKRHNFNLFIKDNDQNIILTYPIYNNAYKIVNYLIENENDFYNLEEYNTDISNSICSCISLKGENMMNLILRKKINDEYITDMLFKSYLLMNKVSKEYKETYENKIENLLNYENDFNKMIYRFFINDEKFSDYKNIFYSFLTEHKSSVEEKKIKINDFLNSEKFNNLKKYASIKEKTIFLERWISYHELEKDLPLKKSIKNKKI